MGGVAAATGGCDSSNWGVWQQQIGGVTAVKRGVGLVGPYIYIIREPIFVNPPFLLTNIGSLYINNLSFMTYQVPFFPGIVRSPTSVASETPPLRSPTTPLSRLSIYLSIYFFFYGNLVNFLFSPVLLFLYIYIFLYYLY